MSVGSSEGAFAALGKHLWVDIADCYGGGGCAVDSITVVEQAEGDVTGAASYVEHFPGRGGRGRGAAWVKGANEMVSGGLLDCYGESEEGADFQRRWIPRDMKSFMASYEAATLLNTPATCLCQFE